MREDRGDRRDDSRDDRGPRRGGIRDYVRLINSKIKYISIYVYMFQVKHRTACVHHDAVQIPEPNGEPPAGSDPELVDGRGRSQDGGGATVAGLLQLAVTRVEETA